MLGAGPLGTLFAVQLARAGADVTLIKRHAAAAIERIHVVPQLFGSPFDVTLRCSTEIDVGVEVVIVAVRAEQLTTELLATLAASTARAVLVFSPLLGATLAAWRTALPGLAVGMPVLAAEFVGPRETETRAILHYWHLPSSLIERGPAPTQLRTVVALLRKGGAWVKWVTDAETRSLANTVALFPLHVAVFRSAHLRQWLADTGLRQQLAQSLVRSLRLARRLGSVEPALVFLIWWLSNGVRVWVAVWLAGIFAPGVCAFVERHFGAKLGRQHRVLACEIQRLADVHGVAKPLSAEWVDALPTAAS